VQKKSQILLLYGHVPDPFPRCGYTRLLSTSINTHGSSSSWYICG